MTEDESFLAEIIAAPDDDGPRLVYADWLEERGDPRAEFIRMQCEEARLGECKRRTDLRRRAKLFLQRYGRDWTAELGATGPEFRDPEYHRGFVESATISIRYFLKSVAGVMSRTPLRRVVLTSGDKLLPKLTQAKHLQQIEELHFADSGFPEQDLADFFQSPYLANLRGFRLYGTYSIGSVLASGLASASLPKLASLDLGPIQTVDSSWVTTLLTAQWLSSVEVLCLRNLSDAAVRAIAASPRLGKLKDWDLAGSGQPLSAETGRTLAASPLTQRLEHLKMEFCGMEVGGLQAMAAAHWPRLQTLNFNFAELGPAGVEALAAGNWPALKVLNLASSAMESRGLNALLRRPWLKSLERLSLRDNRLTKQDILNLIASPNWSHKTHINLDGNGLRQSGAEEILEKLGRIGGPLPAEIRRVTMWRP